MALNLEGLIPATFLQMTAGAEIDEPELRRYIRWVSDQGPVALAINAETGEGPYLTRPEKVRVIDTTSGREQLLPISDEERDLLRRTLAEVGLLAIATA